MTSFSGDLNLRATELRLGLPGTEEMERDESNKRGLKRVHSEVSEDCKSQSINEESTEKETNQVAKMQIVGWPPIRSYRKNVNKERKTEGDDAGVLVKVSMDGAPYLRKIDLKAYRGYPELLKSLVNMFKCFNIGEYCHGSEYVVTYVDKDEDWMLAGDVPWGMFVSSCKRLRIMKGTEARGLHPLA